MPHQSTTVENGRELLSAEERGRFENHIAEIFRRMGMNLDSEACKRTPRRWVQAMFDMTEGYGGDDNINVTFEREESVNRAGGPPAVQIVEGPISFTALCEHHALPFIGRAYVGYLRNERILGLSKFTRIVRKFARRFTVQERMAQEIADELELILTRVHGVIVCLQAHHDCTQCRGVREMGASTRTLAKRGLYIPDNHLVGEFMSLVSLHGPF